MAEKHFYEQQNYTRDYLLPYFQKEIENFQKLKLLEVGCAEGGLLDVLQEIGMKVKGIEINSERVKTALEKNPHLDIVVGDITDPAAPELLNEKFDMIVIREVVEHLPDKITAFRNLSALLNDKGYIFVSFPPKYSPFAGHQQIGRTFLKAIPYLHMLPKPALDFLAGKLNEREGFVDEIKLHYSTGMSINNFEFLSLIAGLKPVRKELFLFRPIYVQRYGIPKIKLPDIPPVRECITFGYEALMRKQI